MLLATSSKGAQLDRVAGSSRLPRGDSKKIRSSGELFGQHRRCRPLLYESIDRVAMSAIDSYQTP